MEFLNEEQELLNEEKELKVQALPPEQKQLVKVGHRQFRYLDDLLVV